MKCFKLCKMYCKIISLLVLSVSSILLTVVMLKETGQLLHYALTESLVPKGTFEPSPFNFTEL